MNQYSYRGPVMEFDRCVMDRFEASTAAVSERKALSNLTFQFKRRYSKPANSKISLPGKIVLVG